VGCKCIDFLRVPERWNAVKPHHQENRTPSKIIPRVLSTMLKISIAATLLTLIASTIADFFISNSTVCHGVPTACPRGAQVITASSTKYNCGALVPAQDNAYLHNGTMGPFGDWQLWAKNICDSGTLSLLRRVEDDGYDVVDGEGNAMGECSEVTDVRTAVCDLWITGIVFRTVYRCSSPICGA
jgi:hypothetical protein